MHAYTRATCMNIWKRFPLFAFRTCTPLRSNPYRCNIVHKLISGMDLLDIIPILSIILFSNAVGVAYPVALYTGRDTTELSHQVEYSSLQQNWRARSPLPRISASERRGIASYRVLQTSQFVWGVEHRVYRVHGPYACFCGTSHRHSRTEPSHKQLDDCGSPVELEQTMR